jgi:hypothetical protein
MAIDLDTVGSEIQRARASIQEARATIPAGDKAYTPVSALADTCEHLAEVCTYLLGLEVEKRPSTGELKGNLTMSSGAGLG